MTEDVKWTELTRRFDKLTKRVERLIALNDRNDKVLVAIIDQITPENVTLGHTWLTRKIREAIEKIPEVPTDEPKLH